MIVVDVGCHPQGPEESVYKLTDVLRPRVLFGFDPHPHLEEGIEIAQSLEAPWPTTIIRRRRAAWTEHTLLPFEVSGITSGVAVAQDDLDGAEPRFVNAIAFDLAAFVQTLPPPVVLKLDCEGSEYPILYRVHELGLDHALDRVIVEWHPEETSHGLWVAPMFRPRLRCPVEDWEDW